MTLLPTRLPALEAVAFYIDATVCVALIPDEGQARSACRELVNQAATFVVFSHAAGWTFVRFFDR